MAHAQPRGALSGPALIRLLARLADADVPQPGQSLADRLSQWLSWTDAITLSSALAASPPAVAPSARAIGAQAANAEAMCSRVRTALAKAINAGCLPDTRSTGTVRAPLQSAPAAADADYADFRQRYLSLQQAMEMDVGNLRSGLRRVLAANTPALAKLAILDASMEQALAVRERTLLGGIPTLLGQYFERLRAAEQQRQADHATASAELGTLAAPSNAWLNAFRNDMRSVLLAELDVRFQPVEGLLAALRTR